MGVITVLLYSTGYLHGDFTVPHWVAISCYIAIGLGTMTGGWRIIETMGSRITKLSQHQGFSASTGGSIMLFTASLLGIPVSTTHTITSAIMGVGATKRLRAVRWGVAGNIVGAWVLTFPGAGLARRASAVRWGVAQNVVMAWIITIPASACVAAAFYWLTTLFP